MEIPHLKDQEPYMPFDHQAFLGALAAVQRDMYSHQVTDTRTQQRAQTTLKQVASNVAQQSAGRPLEPASQPKPHTQTAIAV